MNKPGKKKPKFATKVIYVLLSLLAVVYLLPLLWVIYVSLKDDKTLFVSPWAMPEHLMFENYSFAWTAGRLGIATLNSAIVCG
ncbi:MAG: carbohydrate ABC transporter permease, partial [Lachnospiraceae bacterium]|nr:carbohydrate ABC transporter permease [Lachnospiraceae bacterium]